MSKEYYAAHRKELLAKEAERYRSDPEYAERKRRVAAEWYEANKTDPAFGTRKNAYNAVWRHQNREAYLAIRKRSREAAKLDPRRQALVDAQRQRRRERHMPVMLAITTEAKAKGCVKCGERRVDCLDFHHGDPTLKSFTIGKAIQRNVRPEVLLAEIKKCDVVCANCHQKHFPPAPRPSRSPEAAAKAARDRQPKIDARQPLVYRAMRHGCTLCPEKDFACLEFHHVNPEEKLFMIGMYSQLPWKWDFDAEIRKCIVLCANCHRLHHKGLVQLPDVPLDRYWAERLG